MSQRQSIYEIGANDGWKMGIYLSAVFLLQATGMKWIPGLIIGNILMLGIPFIAYWLLRRKFIASGGTTTFSGIWLHGIIFFFCGSLIMAIVAYVYLRYINTNFIVDQIHLLSSTYSQIGTPEAKAFALQFERLIEYHLVPSAIQMAFSLVWFCSFFGSMLSLILSLIVKHLPIHNRRK